MDVHLTVPVTSPPEPLDPTVRREHDMTQKKHQVPVRLEPSDLSEVRTKTVANSDLNQPEPSSAKACDAPNEGTKGS